MELLRKIVSGIMLTLLLVSMGTLAFNIQPVKAIGTIYIRADGSIDPPTANITTSDYVTYTFSSNIYDQIRIERSNITIDGKGYTLQGSGSGNGFYWNSINNVTIKNMNIKGFGYGIYLSNSLYNNIIGNNIAENNYYGIYLLNSANNAINENVVVDGEWGIILYDSGNNTLRNNNMTNNDYNFGVGGGVPSVSTMINDIDTSNTVNGKLIYYLINQHDLIINPSTFPEIGYLGLVNSTNITVENLVMTHNRHGVLFSHTNGSIIRNVNVGDNYWGICLYAAVNNIIENVTATNNEYVGIQLYYSDNSVIRHSVANNTSSEGIRVYYSPGSTIDDNIVANNRYGMYVYRSSSIKLRSNILANNTYSFFVYGSNLSEFVNDVDTTNTVNGKPVYYLVNQSDLVVPSDAGYVVLVNCTNIKAENLTLTKNYQGILLAYTTNSTVIGGSITSNYRGIWFFSSSNNSVSENDITNNDNYGIYLDRSSYNSIIENNISDNYYGIWAYSSLNNSIFGNYIKENNYNGILISSSSNNRVAENEVAHNGYYGIYLSSCSNSNIIGNNITNNYDGIHFWRSSYNNISRNNIIGNHDGIYLYSSSDNSIYHNNFAHNGIQVVAYESTNVWDDGYPSGGNFWGDYVGTDANEDGIGDTPYVINENNVDHYPLMNPYGAFPTLIRNLDTNLTYLTIQSAINAPETLDGHTIFVKAGTYYEHVTVNKSVSLVGENRETTIIDGDRTGKVVYVTANNVTIMNLTLRRGDFGIFTDHTRYSQIIRNIVADNWRGIQLEYSTENAVAENTVNDNYDNGINLWRSYNNTFRNNTITNTYLWNFDIHGQENVFEYVNDLDTSNTVNGKPIYYLVNQHDFVVPDDAACVIAVNSTNITVEDMNLTHNGRGVHFAFVTNSTIRNINAFNNHIGLLLEYSTFITVADNNVTNSWRGIIINYSWNNTVTGNIVQDSYDKGIDLWRSGDNILTNNIILNTDLHDFRVYGENLPEFINYVDESNTVNGKPIYYWINQDNREIPSDAGYVAIINSTNITVRNLNLTHNGEGVLLAYTRNSTVENINASYNDRSITLHNSHNNSIIGNIVADSWRGIELGYSTGNQLKSNIVTDVYDTGINLWRSYDNTFRNNTINDTFLWNFAVFGHDISEYINDVDTSNKVNGKPIYYWINQSDEQIPSDAGYIAVINSTRITVKDLTLEHNGEGVLFMHVTDSSIKNITVLNNRYGIRLVSSQHNVLMENVVEDSWRGIELESSSNNIVKKNVVANGFETGFNLWFSSNNSFIENSISSTHYDGIRLFASNDNRIYHNNFVDNENQVTSGESINMWDDGYPSGGNYWSDYSGADLHSGPYQNVTGSDGIVDAPYVIDIYNRDWYPLMSPWSPIPNIYLTPERGITGAKTIVVGRGFPANRSLTMTFDDMLIGYMLTDNDGFFRFIFSIPLSEPGAHDVKAFDGINYTTTPFTVIDVAPIDVKVDVGSIHFRGELAEFYAQTSFKGVAVNASIIQAKLYMPDGTIEELSVQQVDTGLYKIPHTISGTAATGTYTLVVKAGYVTDTILSNGTSFKCFLISPTLTSQNAQIEEIKNDIATIIIPDIGLIKTNLTAINAKLIDINGSIAVINSTLGLIQTRLDLIHTKLVSINETVVKISSDIGEIWTDIDDIQLKVTAINGTTASVQTTLGPIQGNITSINGNISTIQTHIGTIKTDISAFQQQLQAFNPPIYATLIIVILTLFVVSATLLILRRQRKVKESK